MKLLLLDGYSLINRAFYGLPPMTNADGVHTNAILGFFNILFKLMEEEKPDYLTVALDVHAPTFRHEMFADYKGTRKPMPGELREQLPLLREMLAAMKIPMAEKAGLEADDIMGTLANRAEAEGMEVTIVSGDRDLLQIASDRIKISIPKTKGGVTTTESYHAKEVEESLGVSPKAYIQVKALQGDSSDNIPGVPGVGPKTATQLIQRFGTLEELYQRLEEVEKASLKKKLEENREQAFLSLRLSEIKTDGDVALDKEGAEKKSSAELLTPEAYAFCKRLGLRSTFGRFDEAAKTGLQERERRILRIGSLKEAEAFFEKGKAEEYFYLAIYGEGQQAFGVFAFSPEEAAVFPLWEEGLAGCLREKAGALMKQGKKAACFEVCRLYGFFEKPDSADFIDLLIGAYLIDPLKSDYRVDDIAGEYGNTSMLSYSELFKKQSPREAWEQNREAFLDYLFDGAAGILRAVTPLLERLRELSMEKLFFDMEMPLSLVLYDMERRGIAVKKEELKAYGEKLAERIGELEKELHAELGEETNINSTKQLGEVLFGQMKLPGAKKTKTGYSTAADILEKLAPDYPVVAKLLEYRGLAKLKSTYADGLYGFIGEDGRIHSHFHQTITATGRISSADPNLQNIPTRTEQGSLLRRIFVPKEGFSFVDADYSQIELRILAHMAKDPVLIEAFRTGKDIHGITASQVFHVPFEEVSPTLRRKAKAVKFGIIYGISAFGLARDLNIPVNEAADYMQSYFATFPGIKAFQERCIRTAKEKGYSETLFGRRRPIPELKNSNGQIRAFGERVAMNAPIQGTAADIMKIAMINAERAIREEKLESRILIQVHDELLVETAPGEEEQVKALLVREMEKAAELSVPLTVDVHSGGNWGEAK